ncbi:hypothetical protein K8R32_02885, partial [bacterium]|nr:hypothetical protein [bacterium]
ARAEKDSSEIYELHALINRLEQNLISNKENLEKAMRAPRGNPVVFGQGKLAYYTEMVREEEDFLVCTKERLNKLTLRYNGFLVGNPVFEGLLKSSNFS